MAVDNELKALARQGMLSIEDVSVSDLEELVLQPDTKKYGLGIIGKASMEAMLYTLSNKVNKLDLDNKGNQWLVEQCKDVVSIRDGEVTVDIVGVTTAFGEYFSFYIKDFAVIPSFQSQGVGSILIENVEKYIREKIDSDWAVSLELISTKEAVGFYKKKGFEERPCEWDGPGMFKMIR